MPVQYKEFVYNYNIEAKNLVNWLEEKDDDGWEFVGFLPREYSGEAWKHIIQCIFRKK